MRHAILIACLFVVTSCNAPKNGTPATGSSSGSPTPSLSSIFHIDPEYYGKKKDSYGSLVRNVDNNTQQPIAPVSCQNGDSPAVNELSRQIVGTMFTPVDAVFKPDDPIATEELQHHFKIVSSPGTTPPVAILDRNSNGIIFWYNSDLVNISEVIDAANEFCTKKKKVSVYEGSSHKCSEPKWTPFNVGGKDIKVIETYVISSFQCAKS